MSKCGPCGALSEDAVTPEGSDSATSLDVILAFLALRPRVYQGLAGSRVEWKRQIASPFSGPSTHLYEKPRKHHNQRRVEGQPLSLELPVRRLLPIAWRSIRPAR